MEFCGSLGNSSFLHGRDVYVTKEDSLDVKRTIKKDCNCNLNLEAQCILQCYRLLAWK